MKRVWLLYLFLFVYLGVSAQVKVIAHRGYWKESGSAQNSIKSLSRADEIGVYGSEFDVWLTRDGHVVVNHDRLFNGVDMLKSSFDEIRNVCLDNGEQLPTLDEYLKFAERNTQIRLILEMKSLPDLKMEDEAVSKIVEKINKYHLCTRTDIIAFSINACLEFRKLLPQAKIYYLDGDLVPKKIKKMGLTGIDYHMGILKKHPEWVQEAHELGLEVNVWTVNREEDMNYFINLGVDYITTDYPNLLQEILVHK